MDHGQNHYPKNPKDPTRSVKVCFGSPLRNLRSSSHPVRRVQYFDGAALDPLMVGSS